MVAIFLSSVSVYKNSCCFYIVKKAAALLRQPGQSKKVNNPLYRFFRRQFPWMLPGRRSYRVRIQ